MFFLSPFLLTIVGGQFDYFRGNLAR